MELEREGELDDNAGAAVLGRLLAGEGILVRDVFCLGN